MAKAPKAITQKVEFHPKQYDFYNFTTKYGFAISGLQSGKTHVLCYWIRKKIYEFPQGIGIIVAPTYKVLQQSTLLKLFTLFPQFRPWYSENAGELRLPSGGIVFVRSADNPNTIEGITANWIAFDEGGQCSSHTWQVLRGRCSATGGQIATTTTPYALNWLYTEVYLPWKEGKDKDISVFTWKSIDSPHFDKEFADSEKTRMPAEEYARRYMGEFTKLTGLVFDISKDLIIDPKDILAHSTIRIIGVDWGFQDPAAIVVIYVVGSGNNAIYYIADEWRQSHRINSEIIQVLKNKVAEHRATMLFCDSAEPDRIEECRRVNLPVYESNKDVKGGISFVQELIRSRRLFVFNNCREFLAEADLYSYPESKELKESTNLPMKWMDHCMDAMRYAIFSYKPLGPKSWDATPAYYPPYYDQLGGGDSHTVPYEPPGTPNNPPSVFGRAPKVW